MNIFIAKNNNTPLILALQHCFSYILAVYNTYGKVQQIHKIKNNKQPL